MLLVTDVVRITNHAVFVLDAFMRSHSLLRPIVRPQLVVLSLTVSLTYLNLVEIEVKLVILAQKLTLHKLAMISILMLVLIQI